MRQEVLEFLAQNPTPKPVIQFNQALRLFQKSPTHHAGQFGFLNKAGFTKENLKTVLYDLKQLHGITEANVRVLKNKPKKVVKLPAVITLENVETASVEDLKEWLKTKELDVPECPDDYQELKAFIKDQELDTVSQKTEDLQAAFHNWLPTFLKDLAESLLNWEKSGVFTIDSKGGSTDASRAMSAFYARTTGGDDEVLGKIGDEITFEAQSTKEDVFTKAPGEVKESIKLRDEFPFLKNTETCPEEFYVLVGHKFAHYEAYMAANKALLVLVDPNAAEGAAPEPMSNEQIAELAIASVENFQVNQDIYKELNHYKENGEILGEHPIFMERKLKEKVEALNAGTCGKRIGLLDNYIRRDNNNAKKAKTEEDKEKYLKKVKEWEVELKMIKTKFNIVDDKE